MKTNDDLTALRTLRDETAERLGGDAWALVRELFERSKSEGHVTVTLPRREPANPTAANDKPAA